MLRWSSAVCGAIAAVVFVGLSPLTASAAPVTYKVTFVGSGTFGSTSFTNKLVVFTAVGDTAGVALDPFDANWSVTPLLSGTVDVFGIGTATVTGGLKVAAAKSFADYALTGGDDAVYVEQALPQTVDLTQSFGPFTGNGTVAYLAPGSFIPTSLGNLGFNAFNVPGAPGVNGNTSLASTVTPEPAALAAVGLAATALLARRRSGR